MRGRRRFIPTCVGSMQLFRDLMTPLRFIPTCVGSMTGASRGVVPGAVHPHVRGEHWVNKGVCRRLHGSSPRAWGAYLMRKPIYAPVRFIPTCVGSISD